MICFKVLLKNLHSNFSEQCFWLIVYYYFFLIVFIIILTNEETWGGSLSCALTNFFSQYSILVKPQHLQDCYLWIMLAWNWPTPSEIIRMLICRYADTYTHPGFTHLVSFIIPWWVYQRGFVQLAFALLCRITQSLFSGEGISLWRTVSGLVNGTQKSNDSNQPNYI